MWLIKLTEEIKIKNEKLFYNVVIGSFVPFGEIPNVFNGVENIIGGYTERTDLHQQDGFFEFITPEFLEHQKQGKVVFDEINKVYTYEVLEKTQEEIEYYNKSLIPQVVSQRQLRTQLSLNGFDLGDVQAVIDSLPDPNKTIAQIAWDYSLTFVRDDALLNSITDILGITESELNDIFINASKL